MRSIYGRDVLKIRKLSPVTAPWDAWRSAYLDEEFQASIDGLQERIGYTFANRDLLIQALTSPGFASLFPTGCAHNARLESEGDRILKRYIDQWINRLGIVRPRVRGYLSNFLNSNLYFSRRALELQLDACVRIVRSSSRAMRAESQIRMTANAFEALVAAIDRDAGAKACKAFVDRFVLPEDSLMRDIALLVSKDFDKVQQAFEGMSHGNAELHAKYVSGQASNAEAAVAVDGRYVVKRSERTVVVDVARDALFEALQAHPWLLWGCNGEMCLYLSHASSQAFGAAVADQSSFRSDRTKVPSAWLLPHGYIVPLVSIIHGPLSLPVSRPKFHEEDAWPACDLPERLSTSSVDRGPYIDKLRARLDRAVLEVRYQFARKGEAVRYAFYVDGEYSSTVTAKNLNDAANQFMRSMDATK